MLKGLQNEMKELFKGYYTEGKNIGDIDLFSKRRWNVRNEIENALQTDVYKISIAGQYTA